MRWSFFGNLIMHAFWSRDQKTWWAYCPLAEHVNWYWYDLLRLWRWPKILWFKGHIVLGDADAVAEHARIMLIAEDTTKIRLALPPGCPKGTQTP
jgi:hypothetical protein